MPGNNDRKPSPADRPPASRVADELRQLADEVIADDTVDDNAIDEAGLEREAEERARRRGWDHPMNE
jgi:hypothetical protein